jgi:hypothetical protein
MKNKIKLVNVKKATQFEPTKILAPNFDHEQYKKYGIKHYKETRPDLSDEGLTALVKKNEDEFNKSKQNLH